MLKLEINGLNQGSHYLHLFIAMFLENARVPVSLPSGILLHVATWVGALAARFAKRAQSIYTLS